MNIERNGNELTIKVKLKGENEPRDFKINIIDLESNLVKNRTIPINRTEKVDYMLGWDPKSCQMRTKLLYEHLNDLSFAEEPTEEQVNNAIDRYTAMAYAGEKDPATDQEVEKCKRIINKQMDILYKIIELKEERHADLLWSEAQAEAQYDAIWEAAKEVAKEMGKHGSKFLPVVGTLLAMKDAKEYWDDKSYGQAVLTVVGGVAVNFPGAGHAISATTMGINYALDSKSTLQEDWRWYQRSVRDDKERKKFASDNFELVSPQSNNNNNNNDDNNHNIDNQVMQNILNIFDNEDATKDIAELINKDLNKLSKNYNSTFFGHHLQEGFRKAKDLIGKRTKIETIEMEQMDAKSINTSSDDVFVNPEKGIINISNVKKFGKAVINSLKNNEQSQVITSSSSEIRREMLDEKNSLELSSWSTIQQSEIDDNDDDEEENYNNSPRF